MNLAKKTKDMIIIKSNNKFCLAFCPSGFVVMEIQKAGEI